MAHAACDPIDPSACMLPFPNDFFTTADASTPTGRRISFDLTSMPRNVAGKPIDPTDWNRADGFSPGSEIVTYVPGLDLAKTGAVPLTDIGAYADRAAPVVVIDAASGRRWPVWTELDTRRSPTSALIIRAGEELPRGPPLHRRPAQSEGRPRQHDPGGRRLQGVPRRQRDGQRARGTSSQLFKRLSKSGIQRPSLYLAWDFTVASWQSLAGRMLAIRNDAFHQLGDDNLADLKVQGNAPQFTLNRVEDMTCGPRGALPTDPLDACPASTSTAPRTPTRASRATSRAR